MFSMNFRRGGAASKGLLALYVVCQLTRGFADETITLKLWPEGVPTPATPLSENTKKRLASYGTSPTRVSHVTDPEMTVYRPANPNGAAVVVAPGGAYLFLSYAHEGTQVCEWLNTLGVTGIVLKYRTPTTDDPKVYEKPVQDALRAIGLVRHHAQEWGIDPKRVGLLGFSAGGNLLGHAALDRGERTYPQKPEYDDPNGPNFGIMIYGGGFLAKSDPAKSVPDFMPGFGVPQDAPPMFFLVAGNDNNNPVEAARLYLEYKKLNLPAELHIYTKGGHGFGMRNDKNPINEWPARCGEWLKSMGYLEGK